jgi:hypothetical protein
VVNADARQLVLSRHDDSANLLVQRCSFARSEIKGIHEKKRFTGVKRTSVTSLVSFVGQDRSQEVVESLQVSHSSMSTSANACRLRTAGAMKHLLVLSATLLVSAAVVDSFRAPQPNGAAPTRSRATRTTTSRRCCSPSSRNVASIPSSQFLYPIVKSRICQLQLAAENDAISSSTSTSSSFTPAGRDELLRKVVDRARELGPVGVYQPEIDQDELLQLAMQLRPYSDPAPARIPLAGVFDLVYSASPYLSSGRLWGPVHGRVTQEFLSPAEFCNRVDFGPVRLSLAVTCEAKSDTVVHVNFVETRVSAWGATLVTSPAQGGGEWKYIFAGTLTEPGSSDGGGTEDATKTRRRFIRVLEAPNLFVIEQLLPPEA